jgi:ElaB/YqjD/DUF883 family membrane-anchored ribosome-binding protein
MPLTQDQERLEHELRVDIMNMQKQLFDAPLKWEPWKAMAVAAGAGAVIGILTAFVTLVVKH